MKANELRDALLSRNFQVVRDAAIAIGKASEADVTLLPVLLSAVDRLAAPTVNGVQIGLVEIYSSIGNLIYHSKRDIESFLRSLMSRLDEVSSPAEISMIVFALAHAREAARGFAPCVAHKLMAFGEQEELFFRGFQFATAVDANLLELQPWCFFIPKEQHMRSRWDMAQVFAKLEAESSGAT